MKTSSALLGRLCLVFWGLVSGVVAHAGDILVPNHSFEEAAAQWTITEGKDGITIATAPTHAGARSLKVVDASTSSGCWIESAAVECRAGVTYQAYAWAFPVEGTGELQLCFYNRAGEVLGTSSAIATGPRQQWSFAKVRGAAPATAVHFRVRLGSGTAATSTTFWDEVLVTTALGTLTDVGPQVSSAATHGAAFGQDLNGRDKIYILQDGALDGGATPGKLHVIDAATLAVDHSFVLPGSSGGWSVVVASDRKVYAGVYATGHVFQYVPGEDRVVDLGQALPGETFLYGLSAGADGAIYGGTFGHGKVFRYKPSEGFSQVGPGPFCAGATYVRTTAYDAANRVLYVGTGAGAKLFRYNLADGTSADILPAQFKNEEFCYGTQVIGSKVLTHLLSTVKGVVLDVSPTGAVTVDAVLPQYSLLFSPEADGMVYYTNGGVLYSYALATKTAENLKQTWPGNAYAMAVLTLPDQARFPGRTVFGVCSNAGQIWVAQTNLKTARTNAAPIAVPEIKQTIEHIIGGPDGKIYVSGFLVGGTGIYSPMRSDITTPTLRGVSQCEGMTTLGGKIYYGGYPGANCYEHDPAAPWVSGSNPRIAFSLKPQRQDRPFGMTSGAGRVFFGTVPDYGVLGGALAVYDPVTCKHTVQMHDQLGITDLSLIALAYAEGKVYGGTTISGGLGAAPTQTRAKLLEFDVTAGTGRGIALPESIPNQKVISAVLAGPEGRIWLMVEGWLVIYNPATGVFEHQANLFPEVVYKPTANAAKLRDAALHLGYDGWIYGTISDRVLFKLDPATKALTVITEKEGGTGLTEDVYRNLYFFKGSNLRRYAY